MHEANNNNNSSGQQQQQQLGTAGLHQSSSCSSLYSLATNPPDQENIQPGQKRLLYASVGKLPPFYCQQCCGSEFIFVGFGSTNFLLVFGLPEICLNVASLLLCSLEPVPVLQRKKFSNRKNHTGTGTFFSFNCLISDFSQFFIFYNSVWIRIRTFFQIRIRPKLTASVGFGSCQNLRRLSDSDPAKTYGFFRIRIHNLDCKCLLL
jgi:hypothetical protein